jgi:hypothetical protein
VLVTEEFQEGELVSVTVPEELMLTDSITVREILGLIEELRLCVLVRVLVAVLEGVRLIVAVELDVGVREGVGLTLFVGLVVILDDGLTEGLLEKLELTVEEVDIDAWAETDLEGLTVTERVSEGVIDIDRVSEGVTDPEEGIANVPAKL